MKVRWLLSPREFELRVQGLLRGCITQLRGHLGRVNEKSCPAGIIQCKQGSIHIYYGWAMDVAVPIDATTESLIRETFDEIEELWHKQYRGIAFSIEEEVDDMNLALTLNGIQLPEVNPPEGGYRETDVTTDRLNQAYSDMLNAANREEYEQAAIHKGKVLSILEERERRGLETDIDGIELLS